MIKEYLKNAKWILFLRLCHERWQELLIDTKYIGNGARNKNPRKMETDLAIRAHALEKGMSIGSVKVGFGKQKVRNLLKDLQHYLNIDGHLEFACDVCTVIEKYILFNQYVGADMNDIISLLDDFCMKNSIQIDSNADAGIYVKNLSKLADERKSSFEVFSQSRFSVRDFGKEKVDFNKILSALKMCERTPSACNRQSYKIYVYKDELLKNKIFEMQGGCNGFYEDMQIAILICGDQRGYNINELHQVYVDGGIYAMNLLYALHYEGLAAIPLTMGQKQGKIALIKKEMDITEYEMPCVLIGVGTYKDEYKVAVSKRKDFMEYTVIK